MKLKSKIAKVLRQWAEDMDPLIPYNRNLTPTLNLTTSKIQRVMVKHSVARHTYEQFPERFSKLMREDIIAKIVKELDTNDLIKIMIEPTPYQVDYIGEIQVVVIPAQ